MTHETGQRPGFLAILRTALGFAVLIGTPTLQAQPENQAAPTLLSIRDSNGTGTHPIPGRRDPGKAGGRSSASPGWWLGPLGVVLATAAFGGLGLAKRRGLSLVRREGGPVEVVGRVNLSSRHAVYLLRAGDRVLIVGAGSQGPPTLLGELTEPINPGRPETSAPPRDLHPTEARS